ncbi:hypothetical protein FOS14_14230 [Skermania sp. ID1734]|uniref:hypothetical protein n=1 Tax=Skermania sp. ID1734 TaxID=2597516 RepID=UPI00117EDC20|nr:hypothetical protein [Skermania sp. ID1734]TSD98139.1 hypothetical protein FOS14_14230 [Skermania sp. ID1734]
MTTKTLQVEDARTLLGMHTRTAWTVAGFFLIAQIALVTSSWDDARTKWPIMVALLVSAVGGATLLWMPGDPLGYRPTLAVVVCGPIASALVLSVIPAPATSAAQTWPYAAGTACAVYLCVRGRTLAGWAEILVMIAVAGVWGALTDQGFLAAAMPQAVSVAPMLMATFFAYVIRPAARQIVELRAESTRRVAAESATQAMLAERGRQMRQVDAMVRPVLRRIIDPRPLEQDERIECALLEAELRDSLRAPALADPTVTRAARAARERGVDVVLIDDYRGDEVPAREQLLTLVTRELTRADAGTIAVRILPQKRGLLATILINHPIDGTRRIELDSNGEVSLADLNR